jgi:hypothetical protein
VEEVVMVDRQGETAEGTGGRTARSSAWAVVGGGAAVACGIVMGVHEWWDDRVPGVQEGVVPSALHTTWVGLMCVGFLGMAVLQRPSFGRFGRISSVIAVVGSGSLFLLALRETAGFIHPSKAAQADPPVPLLLLIVAVFGCYVAGLLLFSIATIQARVLPRAAGAFLLVAVLLKLFASSVLPGTLALMGLAFATLGVTALHAARSRRDRVPSHATGPVAASTTP